MHSIHKNQAARFLISFLNFQFLQRTITECAFFKTIINLLTRIMLESMHEIPVMLMNYDSNIFRRDKWQK